MNRRYIPGCCFVLSLVAYGSFVLLGRTQNHGEVLLKSDTIFERRGLLYYQSNTSVMDTQSRLSLLSDALLKCSYAGKGFARSKFLKETCSRVLTENSNTSSMLDEIKSSDWLQWNKHRHGVKSDWMPSQFSHILIDRKRKILFCGIPKVASTNFKRIFLVLSGYVNTSVPSDLPTNLVHKEYQFYLKWMNSLKPHAIEDLIAQQDDYFKVTFVREPLKRFLSAFRNKFMMPYNEYFKVRYGTEIIAKYRANATFPELQTGEGVTFHEFVQYVIDSFPNHNAHWRSYHRLCHPCLIRYDFVGKYETLDEDVRFFLDVMRADGSVSFPDYPVKVRTDNIAQTFYAQINKNQLMDLHQLYSYDYALFNYTFPPAFLNKTM